MGVSPISAYTVLHLYKMLFAIDGALNNTEVKVYISKSYLLQISKGKCGTAIWIYFTEIRMEKAKEPRMGFHISCAH